jgi:hypothetical protein
MRTYEIKAKQTLIYTTQIKANSRKEAEELAITDLMPEDFADCVELEFSLENVKDLSNFVYDYQEREDYANKTQGTEAISEALTKAGIKNTIEQTGGFCMVVYIYSEDQKKAIMATSSGICFDPDVEEGGNEQNLTPEDFIGDDEEGCRPEVCDQLVELVKKNLYLLN